jgi:hypothetical protein
MKPGEAVDKNETTACRATTIDGWTGHTNTAGANPPVEQPG